MAKTFYEILGVDRNADERTIKRAYRQLVAKYHPDKNPSEEAAELIKHINVAYETLSNPEKRSLYDQIGHEAYVSGGGQAGAGGFGGFGGFEGFQFFGGGAGGFEDIFTSFFGGGGGSSASGQSFVRGADLEFRVQVSLEDLHFGHTVSFEYERQVDCQECRGTGSEDGERETCKTCHGRGHLSNGFFAQECPHCNGTGSRIKNVCKKCHGNRTVKKTEKFEHEIGGFLPGSRLRFRGYGHEAGSGTQPGSLFISLVLKHHELFDYDNNTRNLVLVYPIDAFSATLGCEIEVPTLEGHEKLKIEPGTQDEQQYKIPGKGLRYNAGNGKTEYSDLTVIIRVRTLQNLTGKQKELLAQLVDTIEPKQLNSGKNTEFSDHLNRLKKFSPKKRKAS